MMKKIFISILFGILICSFASTAFGAPPPSAILKAQKKLKEMGIDPGPIDGIFGTKTRAALRKYQRKNDLPITGKLDTSTRKTLGINGQDDMYTVEISDSSENPKIPVREAFYDMKDPPDPLTPESVSKQDTERITSQPQVDNDGSESENTRTRSRTTTYHQSAVEKLIQYIVISTDTIRFTFLIVIGFIALGLGGWVVLTAIGTIIALGIAELIGWNWLTSFQVGVSGAYSIPVFAAAVWKKIDLPMVHFLILGIPMFLISKYGFGSSWAIAACDGMVLMNLIPAAYKRILGMSNRRRRIFYTGSFGG